MPGAHKRANETLKTPMPGAQNLRYPNRRTDTAHLVLRTDAARVLSHRLATAWQECFCVRIRLVSNVGEHPAPTRLLWTDVAEAAGWPEITLGWLRDTTVNGEALGKHYVHTYLAPPGAASGSAGVAPGVAPSTAPAGPADPKDPTTWHNRPPDQRPPPGRHAWNPILGRPECE